MVEAPIDAGKLGPLDGVCFFAAVWVDFVGDASVDERGSETVGGKRVTRRGDARSVSVVIGVRL